MMVAASDSTVKDKARADYVCSGTDDQETVNTAVGALPPFSDTLTGSHRQFAGGGRVVLAAGTYNLTGSIVLGQRSSLLGMGDSTILRVVADSADFAMIRVFGAHDEEGFSGSVTIPRNGTTVAHLFLDGNDESFTGAENRQIGVKLWGDHVWVDHVHFYQLSAYGLFVEGGDYHLVSACQFEECASDRGGRAANDWSLGRESHRAALGGTPVYCVITGCKFLFTAFDSILLENAVYVTVTGCELSDNTFHSGSACITMKNCDGITVSGNEANPSDRFLAIRVTGTGHSKYITVVGNSVSSGAGYVNAGEVIGTISLYAPDSARHIEYCTVSDNTIEGGVSLVGAGVVDNVIDGNVIRGSVPNAADTDRAGILLLDGPSRNKITNNLVRGAFSVPYAVNIASSACTDNWVTMNDLRNGYTVAAVNDAGTGTDTSPYNKT